MKNGVGPGSVAGHGCGSAVWFMYAWTVPGFILPLLLDRLPNRLMISAATPAACGEAIEVPWR